MKAEYISIPARCARQEEEQCYTSVAEGLFLVILGVTVWAGILVCLWGMTIRALGAEPKADIIPPDYETRAVIISATDLYVVESSGRNLATTSQSPANPSQLTDAATPSRRPSPQPWSGPISRSGATGGSPQWPSWKRR